VDTGLSWTMITSSLAAILMVIEMYRSRLSDYFFYISAFETVAEAVAESMTVNGIIPIALLLVAFKIASDVKRHHNPRNRHLDRRDRDPDFS
jgi:hypothetical protein